MNDDRFEQLLRGYRMPEVSSELDRRVLREATVILDRMHTRRMLEDAGRSVLDRLGFGYLTWLVDLITTTDGEYRVELI